LSISDGIHLGIHATGHLSGRQVNWDEELDKMKQDNDDETKQQ